MKLKSRLAFLLASLSLTIVPSLLAAEPAHPPATSNTASEVAEITKDGWEKVEDDDGIQVFRKEIPGSPVVAFKGIGFITASISKLASILMDYTRRTEWVDRLKEAKLVRKVSDLEYVEWEHMRTPALIMKDRDLLLLFKAQSDPSKGMFTLAFSSTSDSSVPETDKYIRGEIMKGAYTLVAKDKMRTQIAVEVHTDPKGGVPKWVVNMYQKEWPLNTIQALRKQADKSDIKEDPSIKKLFSTSTR